LAKKEVQWLAVIKMLKAWGQGYSSPTLGHKSLLMDPAIPIYPSKLDGLNHTQQIHSFGTILVARSVWELSSGILHSISVCSLLNILTSSGNEHLVTEHNIPEIRAFLTALLLKSKHPQVQCELFFVEGKKCIRTNAIT
jgi:hypothetical protein